MRTTGVTHRHLSDTVSHSNTYCRFVTTTESTGNEWRQCHRNSALKPVPKRQCHSSMILRKKQRLTWKCLSPPPARDLRHSFVTDWVTQAHDRARPLRRSRSQCSCHQILHSMQVCHHERHRTQFTSSCFTRLNRSTSKSCQWSSSTTFSIQFHVHLISNRWLCQTNSEQDTV